MQLTETFFFLKTHSPWEQGTFEPLYFCQKQVTLMVKVVYKKHQEEIESFPPNMLKVFLRQKILDIVVTL